MAATARLWVTALYDQDDSSEIAKEATNMARTEAFLERRGLAFHRTRLQNGTVDLSVDVPFEQLAPLMDEMRALGLFYGSVDLQGIDEEDPRIDALLERYPDLILSVEA